MKWLRNASVCFGGHLEQAEGMLSAVERLLEIDPESHLDDITWIAPDSWDLLLDKKFHQKARGMLGVHPHFVPIEEFRKYFINLTPNSKNPWFSEYWELTFNYSFSDNNISCNNEPHMLSRNKILSVEYSSVVQGIYAFAVAIHNAIDSYCPN